MNRARPAAWLLAGLAPALLGQPKAAVKPVQSESASRVVYGPNKDGYPTLEITNTTYELVGQGVPGRPVNERLVLRKTTRTKQEIDAIGTEASTTVEAWPLGTDLKQKPLYSLKVEGMDSKTVNTDLMTILRGLEEVEWWSVYKLGSGQHLFDTYVPLVAFSIRRDIQTLRYAGLEAPGDDAAVARLKEPHVVAVLTYASAERVIREALLTSDDPKQAQMLRSFADASRELALVEQEPAGASGKAEPSRSLRLSIRQNYPSAPEAVTVVIPVVKDDLDLAHAQMPARLHLAAWKR